MTDPISDAQRRALEKLSHVVPGDYYLAGGVGVAAHLQHRTSHDLDLFAPADPTALQAALEALPGVIVESSSHATLYLRIDGVPASLIEYRYALLDAPRPISGLPIPVASIDDLACMKLSAIASRGAARDFWDLHAIITATRRDLASFLEAYRRKYPVEDVGHVVRSLAYFGDAETAPLPTGLDAEHWKTIRVDFERWVPGLIVG